MGGPDLEAEPELAKLNEMLAYVSHPAIREVRLRRGPTQQQIPIHGEELYAEEGRTRRQDSRIPKYDRCLAITGAEARMSRPPTTISACYFTID